MNPSDFSHSVSCFMAKLFDYKLGKSLHRPTTLKPDRPPKMSDILFAGCKHAVKNCVDAFLNPCMYAFHTYMQQPVVLKQSSNAGY